MPPMALNKGLKKPLLSQDAQPVSLGFWSTTRKWCYDFTNPSEAHLRLEHGHLFKVAANVFQWSIVGIIFLNLVFLIPHVRLSIGFLSCPLTALTTFLFVGEYAARLWVCIERPNEKEAENTPEKAEITPEKASWRMRLEFICCDFFNVLDLATLLAMLVAWILRMPPGAAAVLRLGRVARMIAMACRVNTGKIVLPPCTETSSSASSEALEEGSQNLLLARAIADPGIESCSQKRGLCEAEVRAREAVFYILHPEEHAENDEYGRGVHIVAVFVQYLIISLILVNLLITGVSYLGSSSFAVPESAQHVIDITTCFIFTSEYLARLWTCVEDKKAQGQDHCAVRLRWFINPLNLMDLVSTASLLLTLAAKSAGGKSPNPSLTSVGRVGRGAKLATVLRSAHGLRAARGATHVGKIGVLAKSGSHAKSALGMTKAAGKSAKNVNRQGKKRNEEDDNDDLESERSDRAAAEVEALRQELQANMESVRILQNEVETLHRTVHVFASRDVTLLTDEFTESAVQTSLHPESTTASLPTTLHPMMMGQERRTFLL